MKDTKVIAVVAQKGGVAKTTTALSLAHVSAQEFGKKVLLIDMDPQSSASIILGVTPTIEDSRIPVEILGDVIKELEASDNTYVIDNLDAPSNIDENETLDVAGIHTLFNVLMDKGVEELTKDTLDTCIHSPIYSQLESELNKDGTPKRMRNGKVKRVIKEYYYGFDLIPSTEELADCAMAWADMPKSFSAVGQLQQIIEHIKLFYDYDLIILDSPPSIDSLCINGLYAAKSGALVMCSQDRQSIYSLQRIKRNIRQIRHFSGITEHNGCLGIVLTIFKPDRQVDKYMALTVGKGLSLKVFDTKIRESTDAKKALLYNMILTQRNELAYKQHCSLVQEIDERIEEMDQYRHRLQKELELKQRTLEEIVIDDKVSSISEQVSQILESKK